MRIFLHIVTRYRFWIFAFAIAIAIGLRLWDFSDSMLLKGDQIRDAVVAERVYEGGVLELPLLGPRAGGTKLRLGPLFYYFQAAAATTFHSIQPWVLALPNLIFSLLAIGAMFFLVRRYFSLNVSMLVTIAFAFSFMGFEYSRFSWNPNSIPFFIIAFLYVWLRIFSAQRANWKWFAFLGVLFATASQLHFTSLIALSLFILAFVFLKRKTFWQHVGWKNLVIAILAILICYAPVIMSDLINKGDNAALFVKSIGTKKSDHSLFQNISKDIYMFGTYYFRIAFAYIGKLKLLHYIGALLFFFGTGYAIRAWKKETQAERKNFLFVFVLWTLIIFVLYVPLAYDIDKPRFFLPLLFVPFVHLGFLLEGIRLHRAIGVSFFILVFALNAGASMLWLWEFSQAQTGALDAKQAVILKAKHDSAWWQWGMIRDAAAYMSQTCAGGSLYYVIPSQTAEFSDVFDWAFRVNGEQRPYGFAKKIKSEKVGCIFLVSKRSYDPDKSRSSTETFSSVEYFGDIAIRKLERTLEQEGVAMVQVQQTTEKNHVSLDCSFAQAPHQRAYVKDVIRYFQCK